MRSPKLRRETFRTLSQRIDRGILALIAVRAALASNIVCVISKSQCLSPSSAFANAFENPDKTRKPTGSDWLLSVVLCPRLLTVTLFPSSLSFLSTGVDPWSIPIRVLTRKDHPHWHTLPLAVAGQFFDLFNVQESTELTSFLFRLYC